jgi:eukaryotic-like serine/threonine-protein kinase
VPLGTAMFPLATRPFAVAVETDILPPRYRSPKRIGRGGMGEIFRATDDTLGRAVAIKVLAERYAEDESVRQRFTREALAAARLSGETNIVTIFDVGEWNGRPFIVMEYLSGGSLDDRLDDSGAQRPSQALAWLEQAATAIDAAHRNGVVHRDVKPANLLLDREGTVHVADFGIASAAGLDSLTITGTVLGTAGYLSPEQANGDRATPASDRYALGVVAYELLTGHRPFERDSLTAEAAAHVNAEVPSIAERCDNLPERELDPVFRRALAKRPEDRYATCAELVADIRNALARAAGTTRELRPVVPAPRPEVAAARPRPPAAVAARRGLSGRMLLLLALLVGAGVAGAVLAARLSDNGGGKQSATVTTVVKTVAGRATTVHETVTSQAGAPATTPGSSPSGPPVGASGNSHQLNDRGYALIQQNDYGAALPLLQGAVRSLQSAGPADPYEGYANYNLGYTLLQLGRCDEALVYLRRAQQLEPQRSEPVRDIKRAEKCK